MTKVCASSLQSPPRERFLTEALSADSHVYELKAFLRPRECHPENHADGRPAAGSDFAGSRIRDQRLRKPDPLDPSNRRVSLIVQDTEKT